MSRLLRHYGMPDKVVTIIRDLYKDLFSSEVVHNGQRTQPLNMKTGLREGCLLSSLLFLVALDCSQGQPLIARKVFSGPLHILRKPSDFADNLALLSHKIHDMSDKTRRYKVRR